MAAAAGVLLLSDLDSRQTPGTAAPGGQTFRVALLQNVSAPILNDGARGLADGLKEKGFVEGGNLTLERFNAEGDMATLNTIARDITDGRFDLILTVSTPALQAVANANKNRKTRHVFALVTDPVAAGVGILPGNPLDHPPHLAGYGTLQPVEGSFQLAREMNPGLKKVGVVWNPGEANSALQLTLARALCGKLGIELMEASVDNSSGVAEAASALVSRGAEALWMPGDSTVLVAAESLLQSARKGRIPVFTVAPPTAKRGAIFDLGANYHEVGRRAGLLAGEILAGRDPATVEIVNVVPETLLINRLAVEGLKQTWNIPEALLKKADIVIDAAGTHAKAATAATAPGPSKKWKLQMIGYVKVLDVEEAEAGILEGLKKSGLVEGRDYDLKTSNANGDMATVSNLVDAAVTDRADLIITLSTPTLQAALKRAGNTPIVFTYCASAVVAGAGKSDTDHLPNVTGVQNTGAYDGLIQVVRECLPRAKTLGTLYVPSEVNMVFHRDKLAEAAQSAGIQLVSVSAETSAEVGDATAALCSRKIDAICQIPGNLTAASFPAMARAAKLAHMPLFASQSSQAHAGAPVVVARDYYEAGIDTGALVARIVRGESPARIPFATFSKTKLIVNPTAADELGMRLPGSLMNRADVIVKDPSR